MKNKIKKILLVILFLVVCFSFYQVPKTYAEWFGISAIGNSVVGSSIDAAFSKLGVDETELKYTIQTANVTRRKKQQPQVSLSFNPTNPATGQKITVTATPLYFMNPTEDLYFTWYLKPSGCPDERQPDPSEKIKEKCDFDGNGEIDINDYKVHAARILAGNDFDWEKADYGSGKAGKEYTAVMGGNDQREKNNFCFVHDVSSGDEYEIDCSGDKKHHLFPLVYDRNGNNFNEIGLGSYGLKDEKFFHTDPNDPDTADTGNGDEANVVGLGINAFSWTYEEGDQVGVVIEGVSVEPTQENDSSYKIMWALVNNKCDLGSVDTGYPKTETKIEVDPGISLGVGETCPAGSPHAGESTTTQQVTKVLTKSIISQAANIAVIRTTYLETKIVDTDCNDKYDEASQTVFDQTTCSEGPDYLDKCLGKDCYDDGYDKTVNMEKDELSLSKIKEPIDINKCLYSNFFDFSEGGGAKTKMEISLSYSPEFPMNDPGSGDSYNKNGNGDQLTVQSDITNAENPGYLKYIWQLYESDVPNPDSWGDPIAAYRLPKSMKLSGIGLDSIKFRLNIPDLKKYIKAKVTITENSSDSSSQRTGNANVVIPVSKISQRIKAYGTVITGTPEDPIFNLGTTERCLTENQPDAICYIAKNEIVGLKVDGYTDMLWTINNTAVPTINSSGAAFFPVLEDNGYRYTVELIATDSNGEKVDLIKTFEVADPKIIITSADESVMKPDLLGYYVDLDGKYWSDSSERNFSALADSNIQLQPNFYGIILTPNQYSWLIDEFTINPSDADAFGYSIDTETGILTLPSKKIGEKYNVSLAINYKPDNFTKKVLLNYWNVPYNEFYEKKVGTSVEINFVGSISDVRGAGKDNLPKKILASMYGAAPAYVVFLIRIALTSFAMLIFSKIILSFFPNLKENEY